MLPVDALPATHSPLRSLPRSFPAISLVFSSFLSSVFSPYYPSTNSPRTQAPDCAATFGFFSVTNNLISKSNGCDFTPQPTDIVGTIADPINPILEPLTGNPAYHPLGVGSPAIDNGSPSPLLDPSSNLTSCLTTDQIYTPRAIDGNGDGEAICDIGAIEAPSPFEGLYIYLPLVLLP